jgi:hypothetical protein
MRAQPREVQGFLEALSANRHVANRRKIKMSRLLKRLMSESQTIPFFLVTLSVTLSWLSSGVAYAGSYQLTSGEGAPICEAYRLNFEPRHDSEPMACERKYDPTIAGFSSPSWRKLDFKKHFEPYKQAEFNLAINDTDGTVPSEADAREMVRHLDERRNHLATELYVTRLDLFGIGHPVNILSVKERACERDAINSKVPQPGRSGLRGEIRTRGLA